MIRGCICLDYIYVDIQVAQCLEKTMKYKRWSVFGFTALMLMSFLLPAGVAFAVNLSSNTTAKQLAGLPDRYFAPYVEVASGYGGANQDPAQIMAAGHATGVKYFKVGFILAAGCKAIWGDGNTPVGDKPQGFSSDPIMDQINQLRSAGGDVAIVFGGAAGQELGQACTDVAGLQEQYQKIIDTYHVNRLDFDLEGPAVADMASVDRLIRLLPLYRKLILA